MDFGYINIEKIICTARTEEGEIEANVSLISTPDGFAVLRQCPLSMGRMTEEQIEALSEEEDIDIRKREHSIMLDIIKPYFPDNWHPVLTRIPYFDFLQVVNKLMTGEKERTLEETIKDYGENSPQHLLWLVTHPEYMQEQKKLLEEEAKKETTKKPKKKTKRRTKIK